MVVVTTAYDLLMAQYGVPRGLGEGYPKDYDDGRSPTPRPLGGKVTRAWGREDPDSLRPRMGHNRRKRPAASVPLSSVSGVNQWYHGNLIYRAGIHALILCGCVGVNGRRPGTLRGAGKARRWQNHGAPSRLLKDWFCSVEAPERAELPLCPHRPVALREGIHRLPHRAHRRPTRPRWPRDTRWICKSGRSAAVGSPSIPSFNRKFTGNSFARPRPQGASSDAGRLSITSSTNSRPAS